MFKNLILRTTLFGGEKSFSLKRAFIVARRELRDGLRDWRIMAPIISLTFIVPLLVVLGIRLGNGFLSRLEPGTFEGRVLPFATLAIGFFPMSFSLVIALEAFVGEKERNSLETLLSAPLTDSELFTGKFLAAVIPTILSSIYGTMVFVLGILITGGPLPAEPIAIGFFMLLGAAEALVMVAAAVIVSSQSTSVRAANLLASFVIVPMAIVVQIEAIVVLTGQTGGLFFIFLGLVIIFIILIRTGGRVFNREEILSREGGDNLKFRQILGNIGRMFARTPQEIIENRKTGLKRFTPWRLYRHDIPQIIKLNRFAIMTVTTALLLAVFIGWWFTTLPIVKNVTNDLQQQYKQQVASPQNPACDGDTLARNGITWQFIFMNNTRAVLVGSALAFLTLGVGGILLLMVAVGPIGAIGSFLSQVGVNIFLLIVGFVLPHGIIELPAVVFATAAALQVATCFVLPPKGMAIGRSLQFSLVNYIKLLALIIPMLFIAAIIEANITPAIGCALIKGGLF